LVVAAATALATITVVAAAALIIASVLVAVLVSVVPAIVPVVLVRHADEERASGGAPGLERPLRGGRGAAVRQIGEVIVEIDLELDLVLEPAHRSAARRGLELVGADRAGWQGGPDDDGDEGHERGRGGGETNHIRS